MTRAADGHTCAPGQSPGTRGNLTGAVAAGQSVRNFTQPDRFYGDCVSDDEGMQVAVLWVDADDEAAVLANQILVQASPPDGMILTFGQVVRPVLTGTPEEVREQVRRLPYVPIRSLGRYVVSHERFEEFVVVMQQALEQYERQRSRDEPE